MKHVADKRATRSQTTTLQSPFHLNGDLHVHLQHERCQHPAGSAIAIGTSCSRHALREAALLSKTSKQSYLAIVVHSTNPARPHHADRAIQNQLLHWQTEIALQNTHRLSNEATLWAGVETHLLPDGTLDVDLGVLSHLDFVIAARHSGPRQSATHLLTIALRTMELRQIDAIGDLGQGSSYFSAGQWERIGKQSAATKTAISISLRRPLSQEALFMLAETRAYISLGSDTHSPHDGVLLNSSNQPTKNLLASIQLAGIRPSQILNTWPLLWLERWLTRREGPAL